DDLKERAALLAAKRAEVREGGAKQVPLGHHAHELAGAHDRHVPHVAERHDIFDGRERIVAADRHDLLGHDVANARGGHGDRGFYSMAPARWKKSGTRTQPPTPREGG